MYRRFHRRHQVTGCVLAIVFVVLGFEGMIRMDAITRPLTATEGTGAMLAAVNARLSAVGISITSDDAAMLVESRSASLAEAERIEFGQPAIVAIAEAVASSPCLTRENAASTLAELQAAFYALRDEQPVDVPDDEIVEALCNCFDVSGDAEEMARLSAEEVMAFSEEHRRAKDAEGGEAYRIVDDDGRVYAFGPAEWDETASGWDGERWADDWED